MPRTRVSRWVARRSKRKITRKFSSTLTAQRFGLPLSGCNPSPGAFIAPACVAPCSSPKISFSRAHQPGAIFMRRQPRRQFKNWPMPTTVGWRVKRPRTLKEAEAKMSLRDSAAIRPAYVASDLAILEFPASPACAAGLSRQCYCCPPPAQALVPPFCHQRDICGLGSAPLRG